LITREHSDQVLAAVRRSDRAMAEQLSTWESLDFGVAHTSPQFADLPEANQLREVWLADVRPEEAYARTEAYYAERGLSCRRWTPSSGQDPQPIETFLVPRGWQRIEHAVFGLADWATAEIAPPPAVRVLPARAMPRAYQQTFAEEPGAQGAAAVERLNDANLDVFVAVADGRPAGRISYLEVGDIARLTDLYVLSPFRGRGLGRCLAAHALRLARRLLPRAVVVSVDASSGRAVTFLHRCGFSECGRLVHFLRSTA